MRKVSYLDWEHILLDTSVLFSYMNAVRSQHDTKCNFVKRVIDDLVSKKATNNHERQFYISAISISEMLDKSTNQKKTVNIIKHLNSKNVTFSDFDTDIAEFMTSNYHQLLGTDKRTMLPLANKVDYFCAVLEEENFTQSVNEKYILTYES